MFAIVVDVNKRVFYFNLNNITHAHTDTHNQFNLLVNACRYIFRLLFVWRLILTQKRWGMCGDGLFRALCMSNDKIERN